MANLVDTSVNGDLRVTGTMFGTQAGNYATCATAAGTAAKAVAISGFTLTTGIHVFVKFTVTNTAAVASLTLNVSGTGAKSLKYRGGNLPAVGTLASGRVYEFVYDGTNWELVGDLDTNTQTVTGVKGNAESSYRTGQVNITPANIGVSVTTTSVTVGDTTASIPQATSTSPKMDGTAAVGSETTWAKGDHVHPTDTSRVPTTRTVNGHALSADVTVTAADVSAVRYDTNAQGLTDTQKGNARTNIGAGTSNLTLGTTSTTAAKGDHTHTTSIASDSSSGTVVTLAHDTQYKLTAGGTSVLFKTPADSNTDTKVKATAKTDNVNYKVLATASATPTSGNATEAVYDTDISLNPSTNTITANISGTAAKPAVTVLSSQSSDLASYTGSNQGDVLWYRWEASSVPQGAPLVSTSALMCVQRIATNETRQTVYCGSGQIFTRKSVNGTFDYSWSDLGGVSPENYSTGIIFGTNSGGKYYELASIRSVCSLNVTTTSIFLIDRLISNDSKQDLGYLEISSTCTDATTPAFTFSASLVMLSDNVTNAQIKVYGNASTGIAYIYAFGKTTLTANDTGHVGARGILVTAGDISVGIGNLVTFSTSGVILGDAPSGLTAVSIINSTHTHSTDDLTSGVLPVTRGGTGITTTVNKNAVIIGNSSDAAGSMQAIATASGAFYSKGANAKPLFGTLPVAQGGTGLTTTTNKNAVIIGNASSGTGAMQAVATASGAFYSTGANATPLFGTLPVAQGGTGLTTTGSKNAVIIGNPLSGTGAMQAVATASGAFYSTGANARPNFGTLPVAQGGTGKTSAKDACNAFINALDTGSSTPFDADYYVSQYVNGGTTTTTYHRRPMSALWEYINGKLTSVSGVDISGNAATATSASSASKVANPLTLKIKTGTTEGTDLYTYDGSGTKTLDIKQGSNITLTAAAGSLTIAGTADTKNTAGSTDTSSKIFLIGATSQAANPQTYSQDTTYVDTDATLASTKVRVAEKCTLQFNSTTNALDFVFA